jgi:pimeloyl-ACP methyl ester carboxylesterase
LFFHDLPSELAMIMRADPEAAVEADRVFAQPWPMAKWPEVPTTMIAGRDDRLLPIELQRRSLSSVWVVMSRNCPAVISSP